MMSPCLIWYLITLTYVHLFNFNEITSPSINRNGIKQQNTNLIAEEKQEEEEEE